MVLEKIDKIDKPVDSLTGKKKIQITNTESEKGDIMKYPVDI